ncbi:hypothetical protein IWW39_002907 [Coemansia spiralis]|uniref:Derlin n=1 Tax=Coemansia spiralis TaxID=417178 RepID=A0A9W8L439_9FUNG|nr:hypothetical protein IWW39_002907 [Coemansia spiralis]
MPRPTQARGVSSDATQLAAWYASVPVITRTLVTATVATTLAARLYLVSPYLLGLYWPPIWNRFQIWRLVTGFFVHKSHIHFFNIMFMFIMLYQYTIDLERGEFAGRGADFAWFIVFCMSTMSGLAWLTSTISLAEGVLLAVITLWSLHRQEQIVSFYFGFKFPARYFPYTIIALEFVLDHGSIPYAMVYGWVAAHLYYYLSVDLPSQGGLNYIPTPQLFYRYIGQVRRANAQTTTSGTATTTNLYHQRPGGGHFWGTGRTIG